MPKSKTLMLPALLLFFTSHLVLAADSQQSDEEFREAMGIEEDHLSVAELQLLERESEALRLQYPGLCEPSTEWLACKNRIEFCLEWAQDKSEVLLCPKKKIFSAQT